MLSSRSSGEKKRNDKKSTGISNKEPCADDKIFDDGWVVVQRARLGEVENDALVFHDKPDRQMK